MVGGPAGEHLVAAALAADLVVLAHELDDRLVRLGAAGAEERAVQVARGELGDLGRELDHRRVGVAPVDEERKRRHLLRGRLAQLGAEAVPDLGAEEARHPVEVALAVGVPQPAALAAADHRHLLGGEAALAREVHHQMPLREVLQVGVVASCVSPFDARRPSPAVGHRVQCYRNEPPQRPHDPYTRRRTNRSSAGVKNGSSARLDRPRRSSQKRDRYVARGVSIAPIFADHAHGARLTDADGREYIDFAGGIGVLNLGHTPDAVVAAIREQAEQLMHACFPVAAYDPYLEVCRMLCELAPGRAREEGAPDQLRRRGGRERGQDRPLPHRPRRGDHVRPRLPRPHAADDDADVEARLQARHGPVRARGLPGAGAVPVPRHHRGGRAGRRSTGCSRRRSTRPSVACVILEPVQGEGGFTVMPPEFIQGLKARCEQHGILYIDDEVQAGMGRTGTLWGIEHSGVVPDLVTVGKSLASGMPLAGVIGRAEMMDSVHPGGLGSTYGGNPVACAAAIESLRAISSDEFLARVGRGGRAHPGPAARPGLAVPGDRRGARDRPDGGDRARQGPGRRKEPAADVAAADGRGRARARPDPAQDRHLRQRASASWCRSRRPTRTSRPGSTGSRSRLAQPRLSPPVSAPAVSLRGVRKTYGDVVAVDGVDLDVADGEFFSMLGPSGSGKTTTLRMIAGLRAARPRARCCSTATTSPRLPPYRARRQHGLPGLRAVPAHDGRRERRLRPDGAARSPKAERRTPRRRGARDGAAGGLRDAQAGAALGRPAPARRARPRAGQPAARAAAGRAARRARPEAARGDADRAEGDPARRRHHVRLRHPRPGRGADDERPDRGLQRGPDRAGRARRPRSTSDPATAFVAGFVGTSNLLAATSRARSPAPTARSRCGPRRSSSPSPATQPSADASVGAEGTIRRSSTWGSTPATS